MSLLNILQFPDKRLTLKADPVAPEDIQTIQPIVKDMFETMYEAQGVGLAAIQVNIQKRIIVMDVSRDQSQPLAIINPEIIETEGTMNWEEGCLSFPGVYAKVKRHKIIRFTYLDESGNTQEQKADGLFSVCVQHELDHLDGITFYDHLSPLKQQLLKKKLQKVRDRSL